MFLGIDCASKLTADAAKKARSAGFSFAGRYLVPPEKYAKALTKQEAEAICAAGMRILAVYETTANRAAQGWDAGAYDGRVARECAEKIGMPKNGIIYFAVDFEPRDYELGAIAQYFSGAFSAAGGYEIGVYGPYKVIESIHQHGVCKGYWQCVGWSYNKHSAHRNVYQKYWSGHEKSQEAQKKIGVPVDINECEDMDRAGLWTLAASGGAVHAPTAAEPEKAEPVANQAEGNVSDMAAGIREITSEVISDLVEKMSPLDAYQILKKAQEHGATLAIPEWGAEEYQQAVNAGITDGTRPMGFVTRLEAALMALRSGR